MMPWAYLMSISAEKGKLERAEAYCEAVRVFQEDVAIQQDQAKSCWSIINISTKEVEQ